MKIRQTLDGVPWDTVSNLFQLVGWGYRQLDEVRVAFEQSTFVRFAFDDDRLVAFGRTVDDGRYYGLIVDLIVDPAYQGRGIGKQLLAELRSCLEGFNFCTLTAAPGKDEFYLKQGWRRQSSSFIWPADDRQAEQHSFS